MFPPAFVPLNKRTIRQPVNPLDKATVISIFPKHIEEKKETIQPGLFVIPPGSAELPSVLVVGPSSWWREVDIDQPLLEIPQSSIQIADSIVKDYCNGVLACDMNERMPGLFYVPGTFNVDGVKKNFPSELKKAAQRQKNWYELLVKMADSLWARSNGNPMAVSDDMRMAARELGLVDQKDWMKNFKAVEMVRCKYCGTLKSPDYPVCSNCRIIDQEHPLYKTAKFLPDVNAK